MANKGALLLRVGPGLITGASDDDPSGIATYSQAGAAFGLSMLWSMLFTLPLMAAVQEISARIGRVSGRGIAGNIRRHYSPWLLYPIIFLVVAANVLNLGADIGAMGAAVRLIVKHGSPLLYAVLLSAVCVLLQVFVSYRKYSDYLKWLALILVVYAIAAVKMHPDWKAVFHATLMPHVEFTKEYIGMFVAVLGTTISPYLFFWQASMETEELRAIKEDQPLKRRPEQARQQFGRIRFDTYLGMSVSNVVAFFIILVAARALHDNGVTDIQTSQQAADALAPFAGKFASLLFALGILGTGLMTVPVLAGSAAYAVGEALKWPTGLDRKPLDAKGFYGVLAVATVIGLLINFTRIDPVRALVWSAIINGVVAVPVMVVMMRMVSNKKVMGPFTRVSKVLRGVGWLATAVMAAAAVALVITTFKQ